jgi:hypothetical protein
MRLEFGRHLLIEMLLFATKDICFYRQKLLDVHSSNVLSRSCVTPNSLLMLLITLSAQCCYRAPSVSPQNMNICKAVTPHSPAIAEIILYINLVHNVIKFICLNESVEI